MTEQEAFDEWFKSVMNGAISIEYESAKFGWGACRERNDAEIAALRKPLQDILNAIPKVCDWDAANQFYENGLIDENGNPTKLLTGN